MPTSGQIQNQSICGQFRLKASVRSFESPCVTVACVTASNKGFKKSHSQSLEKNQAGLPLAMPKSFRVKDTA
jgi:hypothetical protein